MIDLPSDYNFNLLTAIQDYTALKHCNFLNHANIALNVSCEH